MTLVWLGAAVLTLLTGVAIYDHLHGQTLLLDLWDEIAIARADVAKLDRQNWEKREKSDVIVSLTTIPSRLPFIDDTLKSLLRQTRVPAEIRLYVPGFSDREQRPYEVPARLGNLKVVRIHRCDDFGPATKFIPALCTVPVGAPILVVDDDRIYPKNLVADLETAAVKQPQAAYGFSGWVAPPDLVDRPTTVVSNLLERAPVPIYARRQRRLRQVDILQGAGGYLIRPEFFPLDQLVDYSQAPPAARMVDDVWMSGHCRAPKFVVPAKRSNFQPWRRVRLYKRTSLGLLNRASKNEERNNSVMLRYFADRWMTRISKKASTAC